MQTVTAWDTQESGAGEQSGVVMVDGIKTGNATSTATDEAGAGGRHREMHGVRERAAGRQEQEWGARGGGVRLTEWPTSPPELGERRGAATPMEWRKTLGGTAREWEGESSRYRALTPLEWPS